MKYTNVDSIENGYIYAYNAVHGTASVSEVFELNYANGMFIGLYLADGSVYKDSIMIRKKNEEVQDFVKKWFDEYNIASKVKMTTNKYGTNVSIIGTNSIIAQFLVSFVGAQNNKCVPDVAYVSNIEFARGILSGYFSGVGHVSKHSIDAITTSKKVVDGIITLCNRFGIFAKIFETQFNPPKTSYRIAIRSHFGNLFAQQIQLIDSNKQNKLNQIDWTVIHNAFKTQHDVVLDPIVSIEKIAVEKHPKMYDLTIPITLNFGLANGLQVRDTSTTGYIQRRLIKGLEDLKVEYDMTVRNSNGKIVQFAYGDDGFDSTKVEKQEFP